MLRTHKLVVHFLVCGIECYLNTVYRCILKASAVVVRELDPVCVKPCNKPFGILYQLKNILPHSGLATGEGELGNACLAALVDDFFPLICTELRFLRLGLACGIAVNAVLIAVPFSVPGHGAHHQIHPVGSSHIRSIISHAHVCDILFHRLSVCDLLKGVHHPADIVFETFFGNKRIHFLNTPACGISHQLYLFLTDFTPTVFIYLLYKGCKQNAP